MGWAKQLEKDKKKKKDMPGSMPEVDLTGRPQYTGKRLTLGATETVLRTRRSDLE